MSERILVSDSRILVPLQAAASSGRPPASECIVMLVTSPSVCGDLLARASSIHVGDLTITFPG